MTSIARLSPDLPFISTASWLRGLSFTDFVSLAPLELKSFDVKITTPLSVTTAFTGPPNVSIRMVYGAFGSETENVCVTRPLFLVSRTYRRGPTNTNGAAEKLLAKTASRATSNTNFAEQCEERCRCNPPPNG